MMIKISQKALGLQQLPSFSNWLNYAVYQGTPYLGERLSQHLNEENYDFNQKSKSKNNELKNEEIYG